MRSAKLLLSVLSTLFAAAFVVGAQAQTISTFDADLEGWLILGDNAGSWQAAGGNPGGYMDINDLVTGQLNIASAPAKYLGDWSSLTGADTLSFDVYFVRLGGTNITPDWIFSLEGPGGLARGIVPGFTPMENDWSQYAVAVDSTDWVMEEGTWSGLMSNVTSLKLWVEYVNGAEEVRIDNVRLDSDIIAVFDPCARSDFNGTGIDDWSFNGSGSISNPENDEGYGGGYLRVNENATTEGHILAPARMLGDWSPLDGNGVVTVSVRVENISGTIEGSPEFIRLTGSGGSAHVSLAAADIPTSDREWRTFRFPVEESVWTVDEGTWSGLLAFVDECRIDADFSSGASVVGFDNFGRLEEGCAPIDDTVTSYTLPHCRTLSLIGVNGLAVNGIDGTLHGLVRGEGGDDGVYTLTGDSPYTKLQTYTNPAGLVFDVDGDGFVSEDFSGDVHRFVGADSTMVWVSGFHSGDDDPFGMTLAPAGFDGPNVAAGDILVVDRGNNGADQIWSFSPDTPEGELLVAPDPGSVDWFDIASAPDGTVWVCDALDDNSLFALAPDGTITGLALSSPIGAPSSIAVDPADATIYVGGRDPDAVYQVDPASGEVTLVADGFAQLGLAAIEIGADARRLWVTDRGTQRVYEFCLPAASSVGESSVPRPGPALQAYPNPFNPMVNLAFELSRPGDVSLRVYDVSGRLIRTLLARHLEAGPHAASWDGRSETGEIMASGLYFARLEHETNTTVARLVLIR